MLLKAIHISNDSLVTDIVLEDYRTAGIFRKYGIDYCCGGRIPLQDACNAFDLDVEKIKGELSESLRTISISNSLDFRNWDADFLIDFIINVHHQYLKTALPETEAILNRFVEGHKKKYKYLMEALDCFLQLKGQIIPHMEHQEKIIFPYIRQIAHAHENKESYSALLVRTLRKPMKQLIHAGQDLVSNNLQCLRELTNDYIPPADACVSHKVALNRLKELDNDLVQHVHLENNILFPRAIAMEMEMLAFSE